jgi:hypothetical protein
MDIESRDIITGLLTCEEAVGGKASTDLFCEITGQGPAQGLCFGTAGDLGSN